MPRSTRRRASQATAAPPGRLGLLDLDADAFAVVLAHIFAVVRRFYALAVVVGTAGALVLHHRHWSDVREVARSIAALLQTCKGMRQRVLGSSVAREAFHALRRAPVLPSPLARIAAAGADEVAAQRALVHRVQCSKLQLHVLQNALSYGMHPRSTGLRGQQTAIKRWNKHAAKRYPASYSVSAKVFGPAARQLIIRDTVANSEHVARLCGWTSDGTTVVLTLRGMAELALYEHGAPQPFSKIPVFQLLTSLPDNPLVDTSSVGLYYSVPPFANFLIVLTEDDDAVPCALARGGDGSWSPTSLAHILRDLDACGKARHVFHAEHEMKSKLLDVNWEQRAEKWSMRMTFEYKYEGIHGSYWFCDVAYLIEQRPEGPFCTEQNLLTTDLPQISASTAPVWLVRGVTASCDGQVRLCFGERTRWWSDPEKLVVDTPLCRFNVTATPPKGRQFYESGTREVAMAPAGDFLLLAYIHADFTNRYHCQHIDGTPFYDGHIAVQLYHAPSTDPRTKDCYGLHEEFSIPFTGVPVGRDPRLVAAWSPCGLYAILATNLGDNAPHLWYTGTLLTLTVHRCSDAARAPRAKVSSVLEPIQSRSVPERLAWTRTGILMQLEEHLDAVLLRADGNF